MRAVILIVAASLCVGCESKETPISTDAERGPIWAVRGQSVVRIKDAETGIVCYVSDSGAISCLYDPTWKESAP